MGNLRARRDPPLVRAAPGPTARAAVLATMLRAEVRQRLAPTRAEVDDVAHIEPLAFLNRRAAAAVRDYLAGIPTDAFESLALDEATTPDGKSAGVTV